MAAPKWRIKWLVALSVIVSTLAALAFISIEQNSVYYYTPQEALSKKDSLKDEEIKIGGMVQGGSVVKNMADISLNFILTDMKGNIIAVSHKGTPPDMFKENSGVVVEGRFSPTGFTAHKLMVKHSEEYKKPDGHPSIDGELLEKSMFKNETTK